MQAPFIPIVRRTPNNLSHFFMNKAVKIFMGIVLISPMKTFKMVVCSKFNRYFIFKKMDKIVLIKTKIYFFFIFLNENN